MHLPCLERLSPPQTSGSVRTRCLLPILQINALILAIPQSVECLKINRPWLGLGRSLVGCLDPRVVPKSNALRNKEHVNRRKPTLYRKELS
jgi:hypothetical protein